MVIDFDVPIPVLAILLDVGPIIGIYYVGIATYKLMQIAVNYIVYIFSRYCTPCKEK